MGLLSASRRNDLEAFRAVIRVDRRTGESGSNRLLVVGDGVGGGTALDDDVLKRDGEFGEVRLPAR